MRRAIDIDSDVLDKEGLCYDPERAVAEGLHEEMAVKIDGREIEVSNELFDALLNATDLAVNVGPGEVQKVSLEVEYTYDFGKIEQLV